MLLFIGDIIGFASGTCYKEIYLILLTPTSQTLWYATRLNSSKVNRLELFSEVISSIDFIFSPNILLGLELVLFVIAPTHPPTKNC